MEVTRCWVWREQVRYGTREHAGAVGRLAAICPARLMMRRTRAPPCYLRTGRCGAVTMLIYGSRGRVRVAVVSL